MLVDQELLRLAIKPTGWGEVVFRNTGGIWTHTHIKAPSGTLTKWSPLGDDGDAFRLAVELKMDIMVDSVRCVDYGVCVNIQGESCFAVRRAIVAVAAEIGRRIGKDNPTGMGDRIRDGRKEKGLTLEGLAEKAGTSKSYIWELENRVLENPSVYRIARIASILGVTIEYLVGEL